MTTTLRVQKLSNLSLFHILDQVDFPPHYDQQLQHQHHLLLLLLLIIIMIVILFVLIMTLQVQKLSNLSPFHILDQVDCQHDDVSG